MVMVYRPEHPDCNENGMVDRCLTYAQVEHNDAPYVVSDTMEPTRHMCDGRTYDSKAKFREVTRAHGCVEVGNDTATLLKPRKPVELDRGQRRDDIRRAMHELRNGRRV